MAEGAGNQAVLKIGGDAEGASSAFNTVMQGFQRLEQGAKQAAAGIKSAFSTLDSVFSGIKTALEKAWSGIKSIGEGIHWIYDKLKWAVLGVVGAIGTSIHFWNKEIEAQTRLDSQLKKNVGNYQAARREIDMMIAIVQRRTNFTSDDIRQVFGSFFQVVGPRGFQLGRRFLEPILNYAAQYGEQPENIAWVLSRALATGNAGMLARQGIIINEQAFRRDPEAALLEAITTSVDPRAAEEARKRNPWPAARQQFEDIIKNIGQSFAVIFNPIIEKLAQALQSFAEATKGWDLQTWGGLIVAVAQDAWDNIFEYAKLKWDEWTAYLQEKWPEWRDALLKTWNDFWTDNKVIDAISNAIKEGFSQLQKSGWSWIQANPATPIAAGAATGAFWGSKYGARGALIGAGIGASVAAIPIISHNIARAWGQYKEDLNKQFGGIIKIGGWLIDQLIGGTAAAASLPIIPSGSSMQDLIYHDPFDVNKAGLVTGPGGGIQFIQDKPLSTEEARKLGGASHSAMHMALYGNRAFDKNRGGLTGLQLESKRWQRHMPSAYQRHLDPATSLEDENMIVTDLLTSGPRAFSDAKTRFNRAIDAMASDRRRGAAMQVA